MPRDQNDIPLLRSGDTHQITNPNSDRLITGWDISRFEGPLTWDEEVQRRTRFQKIDWHNDAGASAPPKEDFATREQFTAALLSAGSRGDPNKKYDLLIIGAGMVGCVLAARIAEKGVNPANGEPLRVGLIEWGPYLKGAARPGYGHPLRRLLFSNVIHEFGDGGRYLNPWGGGCLVGGSAMHFNAQAFHPFDVDYLHWQNETGVDWTEENFKEAVEEVKTMFNVHPVPETLLVPGQRLFEKAVKKLGYTPQRMAHARKNCIYCGIGCAGTQMCKYDSKMNSFVAYIPIAEKHGVEIIPNTKVDRVIIEKRGSDFVATGAWAEQGGTKVKFSADKVLLCASINGTPWILYNSGYGPKELLGKDLMVENPNVGRNVDGQFSMESFPAYFASPIKEGSPGSPGAYFFFQDGAPNGNDRLIFRETLCGMEIPDSMAVHEFAPPFGWEHKKFMQKRGDHIAGRVSLQHLRGDALGGYVKRDGEHVFPAADAKAASRAKEGLLIIRDIYREMGAERIGNFDALLNELERPGSSGRSRSPLRGNLECGSCRAGVDRKNSVVNERFECHDVRNLFMCDLSVLPRVTCGNPGIAMAAHVACFAWRRIVKDHFSRS